jgi:type IV pilus assembly protein PilM
MKRDLLNMTAFKYIGDARELVLQFEDIFKEINMLLDFYRYSLNSEKHDVTKFLLNGDHPMLQAIYDEILERFDIPVEIISLLADSKEKAGSVPTNFLLSLGLALKEVK